MVFDTVVPAHCRFNSSTLVTALAEQLDVTRDKLAEMTHSIVHHDGKKKMAIKFKTTRAVRKKIQENQGQLHLPFDKCQP